MIPFTLTEYFRHVIYLACLHLAQLRQPLCPHHAKFGLHLSIALPSPTHHSLNALTVAFLWFPQLGSVRFREVSNP
jgi:hypothetical protein